MAEGELHQRLVRRLVNHAKAHGVHVSHAALPEYPEPPVLRGHKPDMLGRFEGRPVIGEAEIGATLVTRHTLSQLRAFGQAFQGRALVALAVPSRWQAQARGVAAAADVSSSRLVLVPAPRVRRRPLPPAFAQLLERGRERPVVPPGTLFERGRERTVAPPGTVFQRGRTRPIRSSWTDADQAELNRRAIRAARALLAQPPRR